jgi:broad specificity phosphatase PhoE
MPDLWLIRHGETEWSTSRRHTGRTDIPLTPEGERQALALRQRLHKHSFATVLTSPLRRAHETCTSAGYATRALVDEDLSEWNYGIFEGRTTADIRAEHPGWEIWSVDVTGGESVAAVGSRADRVIARTSAAPGDVALFAHAHLLRILAARWLGLDPAAGRLFSMDPASISILGYEREHRVIRLWNDVSHLTLHAAAQP